MCPFGGEKSLRTTLVIRFRRKVNRLSSRALNSLPQGRFGLRGTPFSHSSRIGIHVTFEWTVFLTNDKFRRCTVILAPSSASGTVTVQGKIWLRTKDAR